MQVPLKISFRDFEPSDAIAAEIKRRVAVLERFFTRIISCRVSVGRSLKRHHKGNLYSINLDIKVPGKEIAVAKGRTDNQIYQDIYVAIRDAFTAAQRQLQDYVRERRVRVHQGAQEGAQYGRISKILHDGDQGYGFIQTADGREIFFHSHSVLNEHFYDLRVGSEVRYAEEEGEEGPQASTVDLVGDMGRHMIA